MVDGTSKVLTINDHDSYAGVNSVAISPNGQYVAAGSTDADVDSWWRGCADTGVASGALPSPLTERAL